MKEKLGQYVNDVVSLSVIILMAIALIAGQTSAMDGVDNANDKCPSTQIGLQVYTTGSQAGCVVPGSGSTGPGTASLNFWRTR